MRLLPRTLFARLMLIWLLGIAAVLAVSVTLFLGERDRFDRKVLFEGIAREAATAIDVVDQLAPHERERWIESMGRRRLRLFLAPPPADARPLPARFPLVESMRAALPDRDVRIYAIPQRDDDRGPHHTRLVAVVTLSDGTSLSMRLAIPQVPATGIASGTPSTPARTLAALVALVIGIGGLTWVGVRIATRPLTRLADAARAIGEQPNRPALDEHGPAEVAYAAAALNQMQANIHEHVRDRTRILAAISHDLLTPITRLRLRAEQVEDDALRERIQADLDAMQSLAREGLDYARSMDAPPRLQNLDMAALLDSLCADAQDMGWAVQRTDALTATCRADPMGLRRALWNLVENGIKFGQRVDIAMERQASTLELSIRDHGPGLPEDELEKVFEPFYRTEASRNRDTGGTGLGLAIAHNLITAQHGRIRLGNAADGGLVARVSLPVPPRS